MKPGEKTRRVREAVARKDYKTALKHAKGFRIGVSREQRDAMARAYECMVHPEFYIQLGINMSEAKENGIKVVESLYGCKAV